MEAEELAIVLNRASDLHLKISEAIERSMKSQRASAGFDSPSTVLDAVSSENSSSGSPRADSEQAPMSESKPWQGPSREARSLVAIREALETLEVQLEDLQKLQAVQMQERENALAELEESRRMLLRRLREHEGKEWEVVHEALAFAGEPVNELADDEDDYLDDEAEADYDEVSPGSPEIGENTGGEEQAATPVTPPTIYSRTLEGEASDPVFNLEASLDRVADDREEEEKSDGESGGVFQGFGKALLSVVGGALAAAAVVTAYSLAKEKGGHPPGGSARGEAPTATLSNRALQREKSGLGSQRDGMPLCTVRERKVSPVKKGRSADVLLARG